MTSLGHNKLKIEIPYLDNYMREIMLAVCFRGIYACPCCRSLWINITLEMSYKYFELYFENIFFYKLEEHIFATKITHMDFSDGFRLFCPAWNLSACCDGFLLDSFSYKRRTDQNRSALNVSDTSALNVIWNVWFEQIYCELYVREIKFTHNLIRVCFLLQIATMFIA